MILFTSCRVEHCRECPINISIYCFTWLIYFLNKDSNAASYCTCADMVDILQHVDMRKVRDKETLTLLCNFPAGVRLCAHHTNHAQVLYLVAFLQYKNNKLVVSMILVYISKVAGTIKASCMGFQHTPCTSAPI